jgi:hypothetical protein
MHMETVCIPVQITPLQLYTIPTHTARIMIMKHFVHNLQTYE